METNASELTEDEMHVLWLLVEKNMLLSDIANELHVTRAAVQFYLQAIRWKLGTATRTETIAYAREHHILPEG